MKRPNPWNLTICPVCENDVGWIIRSFEREHPGERAQSVECDECLTDLALECSDSGKPRHYIRHCDD